LDRFRDISKKLDRDFISKKLDRVLSNFDWMKAFPNTSVEFLDRGISDHSPALISVEQNSSFGPKPFKFFNFWADHNNFLDWVAVTEPMFCYGFRKENGKEERRLRRKEWIFIEEMACSRRLLSCLAFEVPRTSKFLQNRIQSAYQNHPILSYLYSTRTNKKLTNITTTSNCYNY
jgi:hypothetical protein